MFVVKDTLVSLDLVEKFFVCDLNVCKGVCCIEGDAGAPISKEEDRLINEYIANVIPLLTPGGVNAIENSGTSYYDEDGDLVTSLIEGRNCVYTCYNSQGVCLCALEKGFREGKLPHLKPSSCHLYPVRLTKIGNMTAINLHHWKICTCAEKNGEKLGIRAYQFLKGPLIRQFGEEWYKELEKTAQEWIWQKESKNRGDKPKD